MKKFTILLLLSVGIIFSSCDKYLDVDPTNVKAIGNLDDVKGMLGGYLRTVKDPSLHRDHVSGSYIYEWYEGINFFPNGNIARLFYYSENSLDHRTYLSSNIRTERFSEDFLKGMNWNWREMHKYIWEKAYLSIGLMNRVINEVEALQVEDSELKQRILGEAKVIRSWHALKLLQYFAPFTNDELGIPLHFNADDLTKLISSRKPQTEVYTMIIADLEEALEYTALPQQDYNVFYRKSVINAILAQLYTYKGTGPVMAADDWEKARNYATAAMEGKYLAQSTDELKTVFRPKFSDYNYSGEFYTDNPHAGILFFWGYKDRSASNPLAWQFGDPVRRDLYGGIYSYYYGGVKLSDELLALYDTTDIRMEERMFVHNNTLNENAKWLHLFSGYSAGERAMEAYPMFRTAELHLIIAESYARDGNDAMAKQWLDEFKAARNTSSYTSTDILTEIMNERRKEFMTEYDVRWLDLKRNEMSITHTFYDLNSVLNTVTLQSNDYRFAFYIPVDSELSVNPNLTQNPGWEN